MRAVYSTAQSAIAWLGEATHDEGTAFHLAANALYHSSDEAPGPMAALLNKPYWSRVWIVQEFLLAKSLDLWCGDHRANANQFTEVLSRIDPNKDPESLRVWESPGRKMLQYREYWRRHRTNTRYAQYFRLRALVRSFSSSSCTERYDKVYALLGIARDATEQPNPIEPDYDKPGVQVVIDVLRNQSGKRTHGDLEENRFIEVLRTSLDVSRIELARSILESNQDIEPHLFVLATGVQPVTSLRLVGSVTEWRSLKLGERLSPSDRTTFGALASREHMDVLESFNYYRWHTLENEPFLAHTIAQSAKKFIERVVQGAPAKSRKARSRSHSDSDIINALADSFLQAAAHSTASMHEHPELWEPGDKDYKLFIGTNGLRGIVHNRVRLSSDLRLALFGGAENAEPRNALLLQTFGVGHWYVAGVAHILDFGASSAGAQNSSAAAASWKDMMWSMLDRRGSSGVSNGFEVEKKVCLKYDTLLGLLDLCRCEVLDEEQLRRVLEDSIRMEMEDPGHDCHREGGPCNTLHLHPAR